MELVVVAFKSDRYRAASLLGELRARAEPWTAELRGAVAVYRDDSGKLAVDQSFEATKGGATIRGALIGTMIGLAVAVVALPLTSRIAGPASGVSLVICGIAGLVLGARRGSFDRSWWGDLEIPGDFLAVLRGVLLRNDSAIFILRRTPTHTEAARELAQHFRPYGGTVLRTTLSAEQAAHLHHPAA